MRIYDNISVGCVFCLDNLQHRFYVFLKTRFWWWRCLDVWKLSIKRYIRSMWFILFTFWFQGWTVYEILRYAPLHNWNAYEEILKTNPLFVKMVISGVVYSLGDLVAQVCCWNLSFLMLSLGWMIHHSNFAFVLIYSAMKGNLYMILIVPECWDLESLDSLYMVLCPISIMIFVRYVDNLLH